MFIAPPLVSQLPSPELSRPSQVASNNPAAVIVVALVCAPEFALNVNGCSVAITVLAPAPLEADVTASVSSLTDIRPPSTPADNNETVVASSLRNVTLALSSVKVPLPIPMKVNPSAVVVH